MSLALKSYLRQFLTVFLSFLCDLGIEFASQIGFFEAFLIQNKHINNRFSCGIGTVFLGFRLPRIISHGGYQPSMVDYPSSRKIDLIDPVATAVSRLDLEHTLTALDQSKDGLPAN